MDSLESGAGAEREDIIWSEKVTMNEVLKSLGEKKTLLNKMHKKRPLRDPSFAG